MSDYPKRFKFKFTDAVCRPDDTTFGKVYEAVQVLNGERYNFIGDRSCWVTGWVYSPDPPKLGSYDIEVVNDKPKEVTDV